LHEKLGVLGTVYPLFCRLAVYLYPDVTCHFSHTLQSSTPSLMRNAVTGPKGNGLHDVIGAMHSQPLHPLCNTAEFAVLIRREPGVIRRMVRSRPVVRPSGSLAAQQQARVLLVPPPALGARGSNGGPAISP
jgi:hypothetical protein